MDPRERQREGRLLRVERERILKRTAGGRDALLIEQQRNVRLSRRGVAWIRLQRRHELRLRFAHAAVAEQQGGAAEMGLRIVGGGAGAVALVDARLGGGVGGRHGLRLARRGRHGLGFHRGRRRLRGGRLFARRDRRLELGGEPQRFGCWRGNRGGLLSRRGGRRGLWSGGDGRLDGGGFHFRRL